jgi:hypothetical protein
VSLRLSADIEGTTHCVRCGTLAERWSGHVHDLADHAIIAGWCLSCAAQKNLADSAVLPAIARSFPSREVLLAEYSAHARAGCTGCYGTLPADARVQRSPWFDGTTSRSAAAP